jgi:hypothetical protein
MRAIQNYPIRLIVGIALLFSAAPPATAQAEQTPDPRFGAVEAYMAPQLAADLRVGWDRMIIHWHIRQPDGPDQWTVSGEETDRLATAQAAGREIVALLMGTPPWATDGAPLGGVPRGLYLPVNDPGNLWANFVRRVVGEYKGTINHWIIWNEPDIAVSDWGVQFEGTVQDYYQLLKVAYLAAKEVNPKAVIHLAGLTYWHDVVYNRTSYLKRLLDVARQDKTARANNYYFDVFTAHIYFRTETVYEIITYYRKLLQQYSLRHPIWLNETNAAPMDDPKYPASPIVLVTMDQQAAFIIQAHALALAAGAERVAVYKFYDEVAPPPGGESYGLFRPDASLRPAAEAYRLVTTHFTGIQQVIYNSTPTYHLITLKRGKAVTRVAWARFGQSVTLRLPATAKMTHVALYDHLGKAYPVAADKKGVFTLTLPPASCNAPNDCAVGGPPWILVESQAKP